MAEETYHHIPPPPAIRDLSGQRFGRLVAIAIHPIRKSRNVQWRCVCDCGSGVIAMSSNLSRGLTRSCGCYKRDLSIARHKTHGLSRTPEYSSWRSAMTRCFNPKCAEYKYYGGRGIVMCETWRVSFERFLQDMGPRPDGSELDRINNDGPYSPDNCRWASRVVQMRNTRQTLRITHDGITLSLTEWAERTGIPRSVLDDRRRRKIEPPLLFEPVQVKFSPNKLRAR